MLIADDDYDIKGNSDAELLIVGSGDKLAAGRKDIAWNLTVGEMHTGLFLPVVVHIVYSLASAGSGTLSMPRPYNSLWIVKTQVIHLTHTCTDHLAPESPKSALGLERLEVNEQAQLNAEVAWLDERDGAANTRAVHFLGFLIA